LEAISVLVVDDSALMRNLISRMLSSDPELVVAGTAMNGEFALKKTSALNPDVIVLDLEMPELDGVGFLEKRKENGWTMPVVILSAVARKGAEITMKALALGASDFITKPSGNGKDSNMETAEQLINMVKGFGRAYRKTRSHDGLKRGALTETRPEPVAAEHAIPAGKPDDWPKLRPRRSPAEPEIISIGISTGGPNALRQVFSSLSPNLKVPIVVVQHMPPGFTSEFANSLDKICPLDVKEAADGDLLKPGRILIAQGNRHITVEKRPLAAVVRVIEGDTVNGHRPSVGVLFNSVAEQYGNASLAIIMTGMGRDGAREIGNIYGEGGITLAQDEESSVVFGMPRVAIEHAYITRVVSLDDMAEVINDLAGAGK
jgi:two-component system chemotaxis response regulator CheB